MILPAEWHGMAYGLPVGAQDDFEMYRFLLFLGFLLNTCRQYFFFVKRQKTHCTFVRERMWGS